MKLKDGQPAAWESLTSLYAPLVYHWCRAMRLAEQDMPDVFQQVFQSVASHIQEFHKDRPGDTFRHWLRAITRNKVRDHFRKLGREPGGAGGTEAQLLFAQLPDDCPVGDDPDDGMIDRGLFNRALDQIRGEFEERTWHAFWLTAVENHPAGEVALELGMTAGAVRVAKSRVLRRLREELSEVP